MIWHKIGTGPRVRNAKKTPIEIEGKIHNFPSKAEALRYLELKRLKDAGIVKGMETEMFRFKRDLFEYQYPELSIKVVPA